MRWGDSNHDIYTVAATYSVFELCILNFELIELTQSLRIVEGAV
jgi:hypothetical protein